MQGTLAVKHRLLWIADCPIPQNVQQAAQEIGQLTPYDQDQTLGEQLKDASIALVCPNDDSGDAHYMSAVLSEIHSSGAVGVFLLPAEAVITRRVIADHKGHFVCVDQDSPPDQLALQLATAAAIQPNIADLRAELAAAHNQKEQAHHTLEEMDEEMRLAARLQRDFLPRRLPEVGPARFGILYRPASWVSGDIYDVVRLDETHVGFYVADVVGHGMPAALLTMFIKKAMQTKRIVGDTYQIVPPHVSLTELNIDICEQDLPSCQFCTSVYCVLDTDNLLLTYARGGHPEPIVMHPDGEIERLWVEGSLLGVFDDEQYTSAEYQLKRGDRLLVYTDGAEDALRRGPSGQWFPMDQALQQWGALTREEMLLQLNSCIQLPHDGAPPKDDITVLLLDIEG